MHAEVVARLRCPVCHATLRMEGPDRRAPLRCARGHSFDQARQGYAQLTAKPLVHTGDTAEMAEAREAFLASGHFDPIGDAVAEVAAGLPSGGLLVDVGAGTGHHTARVLAAAPHAYGVALDASKACARRAARATDRLDAVVCDVWQPLPVADGAADLIMNVFAPRAGAEFARIAAPGAALAVVTPQADHLTELIEPLGLLHVDEAKARRVADELDQHFAASAARSLRWTVTLRRPEAAALVRMGPSAWHVPSGELERALTALPDPMDVTASVHIGVYRPRD